MRYEVARQGTANMDGLHPDMHAVGPISHCRTTSLRGHSLVQALVLIALCSAMLLKTEEASRRAFLKASDAGTAPLLELLHAPPELFDPAQLYLAPSGNIRCGQHAAAG